MLETEMGGHLGYEKYERSSEPNYRNGTKSKRVRIPLFSVFLFYNKQSALRNDEIKLPLALNRYLENHPETETVLLHFDNDAAGRKCAEQIKYKLRNDFHVRFIKPKQGKDYNEYLQIVRSLREKEYDSACR